MAEGIGIRMYVLNSIDIKKAVSGRFEAAVMYGWIFQNWSLRGSILYFEHLYVRILWMFAYIHGLSFSLEENIEVISKFLWL